MGNSSLRVGCLAKWNRCCSARPVEPNPRNNNANQFNDGEVAHNVEGEKFVIYIEPNGDQFL